MSLTKSIKSRGGTVMKNSNKNQNQQNEKQQTTFDEDVQLYVNEELQVDSGDLKDKIGLVKKNI